MPLASPLLVRAATCTAQAKSPPGGPFLHHVCDTSLTGIPMAKGGTDITPEDLMDAPDFAAQGGLLHAHALFGDRLRPLLDELPQVLIA